MSELPSKRFGRHLHDLWALDPAITYLNHGTVGAPPRAVLAAQQAIRDEIERQPARFLLRELAATTPGRMPAGPPRLRVAADAVAAFLGARGGDLVFVDNATTGANAVLRSFEFAAGDEVVVLDQAYGAIRKAAEYATRVRGATTRVIRLPGRVEDPSEVVSAFADALGPRTRLAIVDHITSESALILPVTEMAAVCRARGIAVLVDAAHAPGAIPVDIPALGVDWYAANLHKWAWSPRSSGILWSAPRRQAGLHPSIVSWGLDAGFVEEFDWPGTRDPSAHLAAPAALDYLRSFGVEAVQRYNHDLAWAAGSELAAHWGTALLGPEPMIGTMVTVPLPADLGATADDARRLRDALLFDESIEVAVGEVGGVLRVRISAQIYNDGADIERLVRAIDARRPG